jgi:hypothetical protein
MSPLARALARLAFLAAAFALGTWAFGWWAVPVLAAAWAVARSFERPPTRAVVRGSGERSHVRGLEADVMRTAPVEAALAALVAWAALLAAGSERLLARFGGIWLWPLLFLGLDVYVLARFLIPYAHL